MDLDSIWCKIEHKQGGPIMARSKASFTAALLFILMFALLSLRAQDSPQWRGPKRDGIIPSYAGPQTWPEQLKQKWQLNVGTGHSSPLLAGKNVYVFTRQGEQEVVTNIDIGTGKVLWRDAYDAPYTLNPIAKAHGKGPKSTPAFSSGKLFTLGVAEILSCYDAKTGKVLWRREFSSAFKSTSPEYGTSTSPIVDGKLVIAYVGGPNSGALTAFDTETGKTVWQWPGDGPGYASPILIEAAGVRQIVTQSQKKIIGINVADGKLLWEIPFNTPYIQNIITPIIYKDILIFSGVEQGVTALRIMPNGREWKTEKVWENKSASFYMSDPVVSEERLFGMSHRNKGSFIALDASTGKMLWETAGREGDNAAILVGGDKLFLLTSDAVLIVAKASGTAFEPIRRYTVAKSLVYAHPVISGSNILVKDVETLTLWSAD
jgi:outer membrane protein assembly factor BamB